VAILTYVNLINYMDRYTIAGKIWNFLNFLLIKIPFHWSSAWGVAFI
jgi:cell shape-determining protein MreD